MVDFSKKTHTEVEKVLSGENIPPELKAVDDNLEFEKDILEKPIPPGYGKVKVFDCETWDISKILKGNYWGHTIFSTDKTFKLALKAVYEQQKKYLKKRNAVDFNWLWLLLLIAIGIGGVVFVIAMLLPSLGGISIGGLIP